MGILYNMTAWTEHIKEFAKTHGITYGVAMKSPECKSSYKKGGETAPATPQEAPKKTRGRPKKVVAPVEGEDNIKMVIAEKKPRGRPKKVVAPAEEKVEGEGLVKPATLKKLVAKLRADIKHHKGEGRPVDYLQACIKMLQGKMKGGSTSTQKGICAEIRTYIPDGDTDLYNHLSFIIHSGDRNPNKHGSNPYTDPTNSYDDYAESVIEFAKDKIARKGGIRRPYPTKAPFAKKKRAGSPIRVSPEVGARFASASKNVLAPSPEPFVPKEFARGRGIATMPSGSRIYPLTLGQVAKLARGIV
jgi:hypothetical protein